MEPDEVDNQLEELEIRVERLRALYEQYFLGIEKVEPAVPRKDERATDTARMHPCTRGQYAVCRCPCTCVPMRHPTKKTTHAI